MPAHTSIIFRLLQIAAVAVFAGRAYQHLFWDAPYRELFWDPNYIQGLIEGLTSMTWEEYVTNPKGDRYFQRFVFIQGIFYSICTLVSLFIRKLPKWTRWLLVVGAVDLIFLALIYMKDKFYHFGQFFEYSLQFGTPLFLFYYLKNETLSNRLILWMKVAIALTFTCHGLYAIGYYPRPMSFMAMTQNILGLGSTGTDWFLNIAGLLDFVVSVGIFVLKGKAERVFLWYAVLWGALTSVARIIGNFYVDFPLESLHQWVFESIFRFPHFLIPLVLIVAGREKFQRS